MKIKHLKSLITFSHLLIILVGFSISALCDIRRISTTDEHIRTLSDVVRNARNQVLITTKGVNRDTLETADLFRLMPAAAARGVRVYIYDYLDQPIEPELLNFFEGNGINYQQTLTHAKILSCDKQFVAVGSCNWLNCVDRRYPESFYSTTIFTDPGLCEDLAERLWEQIINYQRIYFQKLGGARRIDTHGYEYPQIPYEIGDGSQLVYIPTLRAHLALIDEVMFAAKRRLIICSNFPGNNLVEDFSRKKIGDLLRRGVQVCFVCNATAPELGIFENYLGRLFNWPNLYLLKFPNIHVLSVIVDDDVYIDGSFNWLSAVRDEDDLYHNHEASLMVRGTKGRVLVDNFLNTGIGRAINDSLGRPSEGHLEYVRQHK